MDYEISFFCFPENAYSLFLIWFWRLWYSSYLFTKDHWYQYTDMALHSIFLKSFSHYDIDRLATSGTNSYNKGKTRRTKNLPTPSGLHPSPTLECFCTDLVPSPAPAPPLHALEEIMHRLITTSFTQYFPHSPPFHLTISRLPCVLPYF